MGYYTQQELENMGFKSLGKNVKISVLARIYNPEKTILGNNVRIDDFCVLMGKLVIKDYVHIAMFCHLGGTDKGIVLEEHSECAYRCTIITHSSDYSLSTLHSPCVPEQQKKARIGRVHVGKYSLIGYDCLVMPGVFIAEGCSFGAYSYINKSTQPWGLYEGKPARRIRENSKECMKKAQEFEKEIVLL